MHGFFDWRSNHPGPIPWASRRGLGIVLFALALLPGAGGMANGTGAEMTIPREIITGVFLGPGVECPQFRLDTGERISLSGPLPEAEIGATLTLSGQWALFSGCMQGREFRIRPDETE